MENLNAEQIKKALECCKTTTPEDCIECPYRKKGNSLYVGCVNALIKDALALITSQEQRIGELTEESERLRNRITCQVVLPDEKLEEIKNECLERVELDIKKIEADTVRKMHERLTSFFANDDFVKYNEVDADYINECIDQIAKELLNDAGE